MKTISQVRQIEGNSSNAQSKTFDTVFSPPPSYYVLAALKATGETNHVGVADYLRDEMQIPIGNNNLNNVISRMINWGFVSHNSGSGRKSDPRRIQLTVAGDAELKNSAKSYRYLYDMGVHACELGQDKPLAPTPTSRRGKKATEKDSGHPPPNFEATNALSMTKHKRK